MTADIVQADYEQLIAIGRRFRQQAEAVQQMTGQVRQAADALRNGGWQGEAAGAFTQEIEGTVFPALARLEQALDEAQRVTMEVSTVLRAAEEEAARLFGGEATAYIPGTTPPISRTEPQIRALPVEEILDRGRRNVGRVFREDYMEGMIGRVERGANDPRLNSAMEDLLDKVRRGERDLTTVGPVLDRIAQLRGIPPEALRTQYEEVFLPLWDHSKNKGYIDLSRSPDRLGHQDYLGSIVSLRYGRVIGDVFGIDPVFGSLLNPTGGMVGSGDVAYVPHPNDAIGYHGVFHDAGGYLLNEQGIGPGYDYLNRDPAIFPDNQPAITGQVSGILWWTSKHSYLGVQTDLARAILDNPVRILPDFLERPALDAVDWMEDRFVDSIRPKAQSLNFTLDLIQGLETGVASLWDAML